jgi:hypothetical protein
MTFPVALKDLGISPIAQAEGFLFSSGRSPAQLYS